MKYEITLQKTHPTIAIIKQYFFPATFQTLKFLIFSRNHRNMADAEEEQPTFVLATTPHDKVHYPATNQAHYCW
jgi:hypothetical protein